jgi:hypothetical protein
MGAESAKLYEELLIASEWALSDGYEEDYEKLRSELEELEISLPFEFSITGLIEKQAL